MKKPEKYWTYQAGDIPEVDDLPPGTFRGTEKDWQSLSPGMRREIYRQAMKTVTIAVDAPTPPQRELFDSIGSAAREQRRVARDRKAEVEQAARARL